jgi:hypothetical protein
MFGNFGDSEFLMLFLMLVTLLPRRRSAETRDDLNAGAQEDR